MPDSHGVTYMVEYVDGDTEKQQKLAAGTTTVIGRAPTCDLVVNDTSVSRRHAQLSVTDGACTVTDLGSRNGTYVNGEQVDEAPLNDGDRLVLGQFQLKVRCAAPEGIILTDDDAASVSMGQVPPSLSRNSCTAWVLSL